jgi:tetratricopeptide (TPR) repeat protein
MGEVAGAGRCSTGLSALLGAAVGLILCFHLYAVAEFYFLEGGGPLLGSWVIWHGVGTLVGAGGGALVALFRGARLGRGWTPLFAVAAGGSVSLMVGFALLHAIVPEPDYEHRIVDFLLWGPWLLALVAGVLIAGPLRGFGEHSRRWAARFAAAAVVAGLLFALIVLGARFVRVHGLIVPELASALGAVCLTGLMSGALGAFCGAWRDRKASLEATDRARRSWLSSGAAWLTLALLWIAPLVSGLAAVGTYESQRRWTIGNSVLADIPLIRTSEQYFIWRLKRAVERQTMALPPIDRADVIAPSEDLGSVEDEPYPFQRYLRKPHYFAVHSRGSVFGEEAEALAKIWRGRGFGQMGGSGTPSYVLRFFSRGRLVMETWLTWDGEGVDFEVVEAMRQGFRLFDRNEELLLRLDEIAPMPDGMRSVRAAEKGTAALHDGQYDLALQELDLALDLDPQNTIARESMVRLLMDTGEYDKAIEQCDALIGMDATEYEVYHSRAEAHFALGDYREAIDDYSLAVQAQPDWLPPPIDAWDGRARAYEAIGDLERALADFNAIHNALAPPPGTEVANGTPMGMSVESYPEREWSEYGQEDTGGSYRSPFLPHAAAHSTDPEVSAGDIYSWNRRYYLHRAQVREALGDAEGARADRHIAQLAESSCDGDSDTPYDDADPVELPDSGRE